MNLCSENCVLGINAEMWSDIKLALVECLKLLSLIYSSLGSAKNHEFLWLICYVAQQREFCYSGKVDCLNLRFCIVFFYIVCCVSSSAVGLPFAKHVDEFWQVSVSQKHNSLSIFN